MKTLSMCSLLLSVALAWIPIWCSAKFARSADVSGSINSALQAAGLQGVTVSQDRDNGIVMLGGQLPGDGDNLRAESIAATIAGPQVVWNRIAVVNRLQIRRQRGNHDQD